MMQLKGTIEHKNGNVMIFEDDNKKYCRSDWYNYNFNKDNGVFYRWGGTPKDDPPYAPAPEILDLEVSTICHGLNNTPCDFCYKANNGHGENMSFKTFVQIFNKIPLTLTQIAFGIGDIDSNPDLFDMFDYCRTNKYMEVVPNVTINGWNLTDDYAKKLADLCGAVAVSKYHDSDICYNAVKKLTDLGMNQVNIHMVIKDNYEDCISLMKDTKTDKRLEKLNAIVFLMMKPKGRARNCCMIKKEHYQKILAYAIENNINFGMDSCSANSFICNMKDLGYFEKKYDLYIEPCESSIFSSYINVHGRYYHCSFTEGEKGWNGVDVLLCKNFIQDIWNHKETIKFREKLISDANIEECRKCHIFDLEVK